MANYRFDTEWVLAAPAAVVFDLLTRPDPDADWGPEAITVDVLDPGDERGLGRRAHYVIRSPLLYAIEFDAEVVEITDDRQVTSMVAGDLEGTGIYRVTELEGTVRVNFQWEVTTTKRWMNFLAPLARPAFTWAHDRVMESAIESMANHLDAELISWESTHTRIG